MKRILIIMSAAALCASCSEEATEKPVAGKGYGELAVSALCSTVVDAQTRAQVELPAGTTVPEAGALALRIESTDADHQFNRAWETVSAYSAKKDLLFATTYDVTIHSAYTEGVENSAEGLDKPYFEGTTNVRVAARQQTPVTVTAALANSIVRIAFTDAFKSYFPNGAKFTLTTAAGSEFTAEYTADDHTVAEQYWFVRPTSFVIAGSAVKQTPSASQEPVTVTFSPVENTAVAPRTLYTYTFDVKGVGSTGGIEITLNDTPAATDASDTELNDDAKIQ